MIAIPDVWIRRVGKTEIEALQEIGKSSFIDAFGSANTPEDMQAYLLEAFSWERLRLELEHPESQFFFAVAVGHNIAYLKLNKGTAQTDDKLDNALEIERIYVRSAFYGQKVGQRLLEHALEIAQEEKVETIWLGVWEKNPKAIRFYEKHGFTAFAKHSFLLGQDQQTDILMKRKLLT